MNPIVRKDLSTLLRSPVAGAMQVAFIAVLGLLVVSTWPRGGMVPLASAARGDVLLLLVLAQMAMLALFVPGAAALSIVGERVAGTLEMLYASRLSPVQIIAGKLISVLALPAVLLLSASPFLALLYARGDLEMQAFAQTGAVLLLTAIFTAIVPMAISASCQQASTALVLSYLVVLGIFGGTLVPAAVMLATQEGHIAAFLHLLRGLSPLAAVLSLLQPQPGDFDGSVHGLVASWKVFAATTTVMILLCVMQVASVLRRAPDEKPVLKPRRAHLLGRLFEASDAPRPLRGRNPMFAKERRTNRLGSTVWIARCFYGALVLSLLLSVMSLYGGMEHPDILQYVAYVLVCLQVGVIALVAPALTSASIVSEREESTLEALQMTPLRPGQVFWGKLIPPLLPGVVLMVALVPAYAVICLMDPLYLLIVHRLAAVVAMLLLLCCIVGLAASAMARSSIQATLTAYAVVAGIVVLPAGAWWLSGMALDEQLGKRVAVLSPLVAALGMLPGAVDRVDVLLWSHLLWAGGIAAALLVLTRWRLGVLLKRGS